MNKIELVQQIGNEVCEGCSPSPDCGEDPQDCYRIQNAIEWLDKYVAEREGKAEVRISAEIKIRQKIEAELAECRKQLEIAYSKGYNEGLFDGYHSG